MVVLKDAFENCMMQSHAKQYLKAVTTLQELEDSLISERVAETFNGVLDALEHSLTNKHNDLARIYGAYLNTRCKSSKETKYKQWYSKNSNKVNGLLNRVPPPSPPIKR